MKQIVILIIVLLNSTSLSGNTLLKIQFMDSNRDPDIYILEELPKITFDHDGHVIFTSSKNTTTYSHSDLKNYTIENFQFDSVNDVICELPDEAPEFYIENGCLTILPTFVNTDVVIYNLIGEAVYRENISRDKIISIPCLSFDKGIYILSINTKSFKIVL